MSAPRLPLVAMMWLFISSRSGYCNARYHDAIDFALVLRSRLRRYVRSPQGAEAAREEFKERVGWWRMALGRAVELWRWPAIVSTERPSMADGSKTQPGARS
jgi:hypothetical protein